MSTWVLNMEFKTDDDWRPLDVACWIDCPLACLTKLSHTCHAKERFNKDKSVICPMAIYAEQKVEEEFEPVGAAALGYKDKEDEE